MLVGQFTRSIAMAEAGANFNHTVQQRRAKGHELVTTGVYSVLRHPSYFGFWWWGLGSQVVLGNVVCFVGYSAVLWIFFRKRIEREYFSFVYLLPRRAFAFRKEKSVERNVSSCFGLTCFCRRGGATCQVFRK